MLQGLFLAVRLGGLLPASQQVFFILSFPLSSPSFSLSPLHYNLEFCPRFLFAKHPRARVLGPAFHSCVSEPSPAITATRLTLYELCESIWILSLRDSCRRQMPGYRETGRFGHSARPIAQPRFRLASKREIGRRLIYSWRGEKPPRLSLGKYGQLLGKGDLGIW